MQRHYRVLRVPHMMVKVINLVSVKTHSKRADLLKKIYIYIFFIKTEKKKLLFMHIFTWKCYLFRMYFHLKPLPVQKYYFCTIPESLITNYFPAWTVLQCPHPHLGHNNFIRRAPSLKRGSFASCVCLLPTRGSPAWEPKLYWIPEISPELFCLGEELALRMLPLHEQGKAHPLHSHQKDQLTLLAKLLHRFLPV